DPARVAVPAPVPQPRRRLRADSWARLGRAVDGLGDPGLPRRREAPAARGLGLPQAPSAARRQLPLLDALYGDTGLGHGSGAACARPQAVPAALDLAILADDGV